MARVDTLLAFDPVRGEEGLHPIPKVLVDNGVMLARTAFALVDDLPPIEAVSEHAVKCTASQGKPYEQRIRPFGFLWSFMARTGVFVPPHCLEEAAVDGPKRGRPRKTGRCKPIAPYDIDPLRALPKLFDRVTGESIGPEQLKTYAEALAQYHLSCEDKFANGEFVDRGRTERRHVVATTFDWIGKEANRVGDSGEADPVRSAVEVFTELAECAVEKDSKTR